MCGGKFASKTFLISLISVSSGLSIAKLWLGGSEIACFYLFYYPFFPLVWDDCSFTSGFYLIGYLTAESFSF